MKALDPLNKVQANKNYNTQASQFSYMDVCVGDDRKKYLRVAMLPRERKENGRQNDSK